MQIYVALVRRRKQFRYLWLAQLVSMLGDWFNAIATVILVNRYTDTGLAIGGLFLARAIPPFVIGPIAGVVADRFNRKFILIATDVLRALIVLGFLFVDSVEMAWLIYVLTLVQFSVSAFFEPARSAILPSLVEEDELLAANTLSSATWSAMLTLGAALGGLFAAAFGVRIALLVDSLTFVVSGLLVSRIALGKRADEQSAHGNGWSDFVDGLRYVRKRPNIAWLTVIKAMGQVGNLGVMAAFYAEHVFRVGDDGALTFGLLLAAMGVGSVLGPLVRDALGGNDARSLERAILFGFALIPLAWLVLGVAPSLPIVLIAGFLRGIGVSLNWTYSSVLLQMEVPDRFLGRVFALDFAIFTLAMSLAVWMTGLALDQFGLDPRGVAILLAAGSVVPFLVWIFSPRRRHTYETSTVDEELSTVETAAK